MDEKLDFSLPEKKHKKSLLPKISILLLFVLIGLSLTNIFLIPKNQNPPAQVDSSLSAEQVKQLAAQLAGRNLYSQAAKVWQDYLSLAKLSGTESAKALFQIGLLLEKSGNYAEAIEYYYRSEMTAQLAELESQINIHIKDCFEKLGMFSALRYELMDRTSFKKTKQAGGKIVAEIGPEKITESDLDALIEKAIDNQLAPMASFMTPEQQNEQKKKIMEQYKAPAAKTQFLQSWLAQEVLYRHALEQELMEEPEVKKIIEELTRGVLSQQLMNRELADKINITETDLQTYYAAHKERFIEPAKASISHIVIDDEEQAVNLINRINKGEDFYELAKQFSKDKETKENGGKIEAQVNKDSYIPMIGDSEELNKNIFTAKAPAVLDKPYKTEKGWEIVKVETVSDDRQKGFDEVRQQVMLMLTDQKRRDVQSDFISQMMNKYNVIIHTSVFGGAEEKEPEISEEKQQ